ncbi:MAG: gp436 family protein [Cypionkella sp.]
MTYCTEADLIARYGNQMLVDLTDRAELATGTIDSAVVSAATAGAAAMIDGYLAGRYALPLADVPQTVAEIAMAIAVWRLHVGVPGDKVTLDYKDARTSLEQIAKGVIRLSVAGVDAPGTGDTGAMIVDRDRALTQESMTGFI